MNDYKELNLYLHDGDEDRTVDMYVYTEPNKFFIVKDVNNDPICYQGWWTIPFIQYNRYASVHVEDAKVMYFVTIDKDKIDDSVHG